MLSLCIYSEIDDFEGEVKVFMGVVIIYWYIGCYDVLFEYVYKVY